MQASTFDTPIPAESRTFPSSSALPTALQAIPEKLRDAATALRSSRVPALLGALRARIHSAAHSTRWELAVLSQLVQRELRLQHRNTALGVLWSIVSPLAMAATYLGLFGAVLGSTQAASTRELLAALIPWSGFTAALCAAAYAPLTHATLLRGHRVPVRTVVSAAAVAALPGLLVGLAVLVAFGPVAPVSAPIRGDALPASYALLDAAARYATSATSAVFGHSGVSVHLANPALLALPALVAIQLVFTIALGLVLALANTVARDTQHALHYALRLGFFLTPVLWVPANLPARLAGWASWLALNPLAGLLEAYRAVLVHSAIPAAASLMPVLVCTTTLLALGFTAERVMGRRAIELI